MVNARGIDTLTNQIANRSHGPSRHFACSSDLAAAWLDLNKPTWSYRRPAAADYSA
jgi:hypothetical protein